MAPGGFAHLDPVGRATGGVGGGRRGSFERLAMTGDDLHASGRMSGILHSRHGGGTKVNNRKPNNELMWLCTGWERIGVLYVCDACVWVSMM